MVSMRTEEAAKSASGMAFATARTIPRGARFLQTEQTFIWTIIKRQSLSDYAILSGLPRVVRE